MDFSSADKRVYVMYFSGRLRTLIILLAVLLFSYCRSEKTSTYQRTEGKAHTSPSGISPDPKGENKKSKTSTAAMAPANSSKRSKEQYLKEARKHFGAGKLEVAMTVLKKSMQHYPDEPLLQGEYGWIAFQKGDLSTAFNHTCKALQSTCREKHRGMLLYNLGRIEQKRGDIQKAVQKFRESLHCRKNDTVSDLFKQLAPQSKEIFIDSASCRMARCRLQHQEEDEKLRLNCSPDWTTLSAAINGEDKSDFYPNEVATYDEMEAYFGNFLVSESVYSSLNNELELVIVDHFSGGTLRCFNVGLYAKNALGWSALDTQLSDYCHGVVNQAEAFSLGDVNIITDGRRKKILSLEYVHTDGYGYSKDEIVRKYLMLVELSRKQAFIVAHFVFAKTDLETGKKWSTILNWEGNYLVVKKETGDVPKQLIGRHSIRSLSQL